MKQQHFSEADLLEMYYTEPDPHLAECAECASRYERLERKVRALAECESEKPETFWARQRISIMKRVEGRRTTPVARYAAAAMLVAVLGGVVTWKAVDESSSRQVVQTATMTQAAPLDDSTTRRLEDSPWQSEELQDYQPVVAWESWVETDTKNGDRS